jgi:hypothetical protein
VSKAIIDEHGDEWRQVWWIEDHHDGATSRTFVSLPAAMRELAKRRWTDPQLIADIQPKPTKEKA